jgi:hypothetical protein
MLDPSKDGKLGQICLPLFVGIVGSNLSDSKRFLRKMSSVYFSGRNADETNRVCFDFGTSDILVRRGGLQ